eukprot:5204645-Prymnesium_polylepis.2
MGVCAVWWSPLAARLGQGEHPALRSRAAAVTFPPLTRRPPCCPSPPPSSRPPPRSLLTLASISMGGADAR